MTDSTLPPDPLSAAAIRARLVVLGGASSGDRAPQIVVIDECASTNDLALERLRLGDVGRFVIAADVQHAGRGRRGATWRTVPGEALAFSIGRAFTRPLSALGGLSLAIGASVAQSLQALGGRDSRWQ